MADKAKILEKVRKLLAKADSTNHPEEADAFRAKADQLMSAYQIQAFEVAARSEERVDPVSRAYEMNWYNQSSHGDSLWSLMLSTAEHCRVTLVYWAYGRNARTADYEIPAVGMPADLDYFDMLFTHLFQQMVKGLEPKPDPKKPMIENLVVMKEAGMKWERIGELLYAIGQLDEPYERKTGVRFTKLYADYCTQNGREQLRTSPQVYQRSFATGFVLGVEEKFRQQRDTFKVKGDFLKGGSIERGADIVLADIAERGRRKAEELFGEPPTRRGRGRKDNRAFDMGAYYGGRAAGMRADTTGGSGRTRVGSAKKELSRGN